MALASATYENAALNNSLMAAAGTVWLSLHSASPGTTGANELSGGGYARQSYTVGTASAGSVSNTNAIAVPNAGTTAVTHIGIWSASSAGTYYIGAALATTTTAASITFAAGAAAFTNS